MIICYMMDCEFNIKDEDSDGLGNGQCNKEVVTITDDLSCEDYSQIVVKGK